MVRPRLLHLDWCDYPLVSLTWQHVTSTHCDYHRLLSHNLFSRLLQYVSIATTYQPSLLVTLGSSVLSVHIPTLAWQSTSDNLLPTTHPTNDSTQMHAEHSKPIQAPRQQCSLPSRYQIANTATLPYICNENGKPTYHYVTMATHTYTTTAKEAKTTQLQSSTLIPILSTAGLYITIEYQLLIYSNRPISKQVCQMKNH